MLKPSLPILLPLMFLTLTPSALSKSCTSGGDCSGGGSSLNGQLLDGRARDNTIPRTQELNDGLQAFERHLSETPDLLDRFHEFTHRDSSKKRFILVDRLPALGVDDVKHDVADRLIALQRGPNVWVLRDFYERASDQDKIAFFIHEFLVSEKLRKGPLTKKDMEEVVNLTAHFSERLNPAVAPRGRDTQAVFLANNFQPGLTMREFVAFTNWAERLNAAVKAACTDGVAEGKEYREVMALVKIAQNIKTDTMVNQAKRDHYGKIFDLLNEDVKGDWSRKNICALAKEAEETRELENSLKIGVDSQNDEDMIPVNPSASSAK